MIRRPAFWTIVFGLAFAACLGMRWYGEPVDGSSIGFASAVSYVFGNLVMLVAYGVRWGRCED